MLGVLSISVTTPSHNHADAAVLTRSWRAPRLPAFTAVAPRHVLTVSVFGSCAVSHGAFAPSVRSVRGCIPLACRAIVIMQQQHNQQ